MYTAIASSRAIAAVLPLHPDKSESAEFMILGFLVVIAVLTAMYLFMKLLGLTFADSSRKAAAAQALARKPAAATAAPVAAKADNSHLVAIIAAAAHVVLGNRVRIVSVSPASAEWSAEGRREIFASRQFR